MYIEISLYGHPDAGGYWERHCEEHLASVVFVPAPDWRSTYWHPELKLLLMVYVDDFKMTGPSAKFAKGWSLIRQRVKTDEPHTVTECLGCEHLVRDTNMGVCRSNRWNITCDRSLNNVESYLTLAQRIIDTFKLAKTPFLNESNVENTASDDKEGLLARIACKVLMEIMYGACRARFDLLRPIAALASKVPSGIQFAIECYIGSCAISTRPLTTNSRGTLVILARILA